jgi:hypothetical protein
MGEISLRTWTSSYHDCQKVGRMGLNYETATGSARIILSAWRGMA